MSLLNDASLVLIPSGYKEDKVYSIIPSDGSGDLDFVRGGSGTRINSLGQVESVCWNLISYSEDVTNTDWFVTSGGTGTNPVITSNYTASPTGTNTADRVQFSNIGGSGSTSNYSLLGKFPLSLSDTGTATVYLKSLTSSNQNVLCYWGAGQGQVFVVTPEWQRFTLSNLSASAAANLFIGTRGGSGSFFNGGDTTLDIAVWGAQLNVGSTAKPYFPTTDRLNVPRLTYENGCPSLLLEKQSSNIITYSEDLTDSAWIKQQVTITANATTSPDGTQNADKLIINNGLTGGYAYRVNSTSATPYTGSFYIKAGGVNYTTFYTNMSGSYEQALINLTNGAITNSTFANTPKTTSVGNGWYRVEYTVNAGGGPVTIYIDGGATSGGGGYTGNGVDGVYIWGAQVEQSSYATSYIKTTSTSVTRLADSCYKTGISSLIGQTSGTMFVDVNLTHDYNVNNYLMQIYQDSNNRILLYRTAYNELAFYVLKSGSAFNYVSSVTSNTRHKLAFAYESGNSAFYIDGVQIALDTTTFSSFSSLSDLHLGANYDPIRVQEGDYLYNEALLFQRRLTNTELAQLTTI
jgi:hypothetical protein